MRVSLHEMRIWSILLIKSDFKWCIHLRRSIFLYFSLSIFCLYPAFPKVRHRFRLRLDSFISNSLSISSIFVPIYQEDFHLSQYQYFSQIAAATQGKRSKSTIFYQCANWKTPPVQRYTKMTSAIDVVRGCAQ